MPKPKRRVPPLEVWVSAWDDVAVVREDRTKDELVYAFTVARTGREAKRIMGSGLLGHSDIEGAPFSPVSVRRMKKGGKGLADDVGVLLAKGYRFIAPYPHLDHGQITALISSLKLYG